MLRRLAHRILSLLGIAKRHQHTGSHPLRHYGEAPAARREVPHLPDHWGQAAAEPAADRHRPGKRGPRPGSQRPKAERPQEEAPRRPAAAPTPEAGPAPAQGRSRGRGARPERGERRSRPTDAETAAATGPARAIGKESEPWDPAAFQVEPVEGKTRFQDLGLRPELLHAIADLGFHYCTPIQAISLPQTLQDKNVAGKAQTGTGKTAAFLLAVFQRFLNRPDATPRPAGTPRALVLAPTRELVVQIQKDAAALGKHCPVPCVAVYGGMGYEQQERELEAGVDILAATPGRLIDFIRKGTVNLGRVEVLIIDEADRMLDMGFIPDVRRIVARTPRNDQRQTLLFSATLSPEIMRLAAQWMDNPVTVEIEPEQVAAKSVEQVVYLCSSREKLPLLLNLLQQPEMERVLVFSNRRDATTRVCERLQQQGIRCDMLSGDVPQNKRMRILEEFRDGKLRVLVATDVAGRGLHIQNIGHVINYDVPPEPEDYVHRIGRTGRAGATGNAITLACERESFSLPEIEQLLGQPLTYKHPTEEQVKSPSRHGGAHHPHAHRPAAAPPAEPNPALAAEPAAGEPPPPES
jgi:ATP-dependent RNA helicase RhlB